MTWTWRYETNDGTEPADPPAPQQFPTQSDAETWIGETWRELLDSAIDAVTLMEDERVVYGPMSLHPAE